MSDQQYFTVAGFVQQFGADRPAVESKDVSGQTVREFTVKAIGTQKLVRITLWPEFNSVAIGKGTFVVADGKYKVTEGKNGQSYHNLSASTLTVLQPVAKAEREVVNSGNDSTPF